MKQPTKGFTLLELLIVIAILAVLAVATLLVLNPVELLRQARDTQRVTDIGTLNSAISLYLTAASTTPIASTSGALSNATCKTATGANGTCYADRNAALSVTCVGRFSTSAVITSTSRKIDAGGWLPVAFANIPGGSPLAQLPTDPVNSASLFYAYACNDASTASSTYVVTAVFESTKYNAATGPAQTDGGSSTAVYEIGNNPGLNGAGSGM